MSKSAKVVLGRKLLKHASMSAFGGLADIAISRVMSAVGPIADLDTLYWLDDDCAFFCALP